MVSSAKVYSQVKEPEQKTRYDLACYANKNMPLPHQYFHASERIELRLYCLSPTHCPFYVEIFGSGTARTFTMGVALSFTRHRFGHSSSISTPPSSQHFLSTLPPLLPLSSLQLKATSLLSHNNLLIPAQSIWRRTPMAALSTFLIGMEG